MLIEKLYRSEKGESPPMCRFRSVAVLSALLALAAAGCNRVDAGPRPDISRGDKIRETLASAAGGEAAPAEDDSAASGEPTGWATLSGTFLYDGVPARPAAIVADKDAEVCGKHPLFDESIDVGPGGGLGNLVIWVRTPKVPVNPKYDGQKGREVVLDNKNCRFEPHVVAMRTNEVLSIKNSDPVGHNSKLEPSKNPAFNSLIPSGDKANLNLASEETMPIKVGCSIHPWMGGWIVVRGDPYVSVSDKDGHFSIADLPAGKELEFQLWQEKVGFPKEVEVDGVKVDAKGRFKLKLNPDEDKKLTFKVSLK
jgi:hypothetical protein